MRTSLSEALLQLLLRLGLSLLWIQLGIWLLVLVVALMGFGSIFLAAGGLGWINGVTLVLWMIFILGIKLSPILWGGATGAAVVVAQPGGEEGLSAADALKKVKVWSPKIMDWLDKNFMLWVPAWFLYTTLFSTAGMVKWNVLLFVLIPALLWFVEDEWPGGRLVRRLIGYTLVIGATLIIGFTIYNTMNRVVADPEVRLVQEYLAGLETKEKKKIQGVVEVIIDKKETGKPITKLEQGILDELELRAKAQRLNPANLKTAIESARPADPGWWKANWHWVVLGALALYGFTRIWRAATRPATVTATGAVVTTSAGHGTTQSTGKWKLWALITLAVIGWSWYSIDQERGFPGTWLVGRTYTLSMTDLRSQQLCSVRPGMRRITVVNADQVVRVNGELVPVHAYFIKKDSDDLDPVRYNLAEYLRFNGTVPGEKTRVGDNECLTVSAFDHMTEKAKARTIILGKTASSEPEMAVLMKVHVR